MFLRLKQSLLFLLVASAAWLPQADAMVRPLHPSGGDLAAVSAPIFQAAEQETWVLVYVYDSENPYNGDFYIVQSPLGLALYAFDGTGNDREDPTRMPTHVAALRQMYDPSKKAFYMFGVGTRDEVMAGNLFGKGARKRLDAMFTFFEQTYANGTGDTDIDIIGFSRGSAMAREFANMVHDKYPNAKIRFLGLFDTVAQVGSPDPANINPGVRLDIPDNVEFVAHAVAKNEYRSLFPLTSVVKAYGGTYFGWSLPTIIRIGPNKFSPSEYAELRGQRYWEKPFAGAHSDIGGGYPDGTNLEALWWMYSVGKEHGVPFDPSLFETTVAFPDGTTWDYHLKEGDWHDSRYPILDRVPMTGIGRGTRVIYSGNLEIEP